MKKSFSKKMASLVLAFAVAFTAVFASATTVQAAETDIQYLYSFVNDSMEICNNCLLILSRCFWKYSHGCMIADIQFYRIVTVGRGGYNSCFNTADIPISDLLKMGGIKNHFLLHSLIQQCNSNFPRLFTMVKQLIDV